MGHAVFGCKRALGLAGLESFPNSHDFMIGKASAWVRVKASLAEHVNFMADVFLRRHPFEILKAIFSSHAVFMIYPRAPRIKSDEGREHQSVQQGMLVTTKPHAEISIPQHVRPEKLSASITPHAPKTGHHVIRVSIGRLPDFFFHAIAPFKRLTFLKWRGRQAKGTCFSGATLATPIYFTRPHGPRYSSLGRVQRVALAGAFFQ